MKNAFEAEVERILVPFKRTMLDAKRFAAI